jgi:hypothetical protein
LGKPKAGATARECRFDPDSYDLTHDWADSNQQMRMPRQFLKKLEAHREPSPKGNGTSCRPAEALRQEVGGYFAIRSWSVRSTFNPFSGIGAFNVQRAAWAINRRY